MAPFSEIKRRSILPLAGLALAGYYLVVFVPLAHRASSLDADLRKGWQKLAVSVDQATALSLDFQRITNQLTETRHELALIEDAKKKAAQRLEVPAESRGRLTGPFQLFDYQIQRGKRIDDLESKARQQKMNVELGVFAAFPEHTADMTEPALLWSALSFTDDLLQTALRCKLETIHSLEVAATFTNSPGADLSGQWTEIPVQLEFSAAADQALAFIRSLPLKAEELRAANLPAPGGYKAPLLIDRLIIRKENPEKLDQVRVWVRAVGFVLRD